MRSTRTNNAQADSDTPMTSLRDRKAPQPIGLPKYCLLGSLTGLLTVIGQ